jgi:hypothetical protein
MAGTTSCRRCGRPILWARLPRGRAVPLDPEPDDRGQVILLPDGRRGFPVEPGARYADDVQARRHWDHLSTCRGFARIRPADAVVARPDGADRRRERVRELRAALAEPGALRRSG